MLNFETQKTVIIAQYFWYLVWTDPQKWAQKPIKESANEFRLWIIQSIHISTQNRLPKPLFLSIRCL